MEVLVLDGKNYVKASKAARDLGYATDYVGQLCRTGQVDAHLIGRTWYVNPDQLGSHRVEKKRISRAKAREQAKKLIANRRSDSTVKSKNNYRNIAISYEEDPSPLIPETHSETRKLSVASQVSIPEYRDTYETETVIENKGEKILMSGDLTVVDVTDGPVDDGTVLLHPKIERHRSDYEPELAKSGRKVSIESHDDVEVAQQGFDDGEDIDESASEESGRVPISRMRHMNFEERLQSTPYTTDTERRTSPIPTDGLVATDPLNVDKPSYFIHISVHALIIIATLSTLGISRLYSYEVTGTGELAASFIFSAAMILESIRQLF